MKRICLLFTSLLLLSCSSSPDTASIFLELQLPLEIDPDTDSAELLDELGLFDLGQFGAFVKLTGSSEDLGTNEALWPDDPADLGQDPIVLEMEMEAGMISLNCLVFLHTDEGPLVYQGETEPAAFLAGQTSEVDIVTTQLGIGSIADTAPDGTVSVEVVDFDTEVILTAVDVGDNGHFVVHNLPVGRALFPVWNMSDGSRNQDPDTLAVISAEGLIVSWSTDE